MEADGKRYIIHGSRSDVFTIWHFADLHLMARACAEHQLEEDLKKVEADPFAFWFGGGDYCDFIGYSDKRFDPDAVAPWVSVKDLGKLGEKGMARVKKLFWPIRHKCMGLLMGNHEKKYALKTEHEGLHGWLCTELGARNLQYSALFDLHFVRDPQQETPRIQLEAHKGFSSTSFRIYAHHGCGYAQTPGGKLNKLIQFMQSFEADLYFCGHVHDRVGRREPTLGADADCTKLVAHTRLGVIAGSYLKTYAQGVTTYGEQKGYRPVSLGAAVVTICPEKREVSAEI